VTANPARLVAVSALHYVLFPLPVITLFWKDHIGMSLTDIMVLQAVFGVAVVLLEFPTGYFADRVGYRASIVVGGILWMIGWLVAGGSTFPAIAVAEIVLGAGTAFMSGADRALLWVSLEGTARTAAYTRWDGRLRAAAQTSEAVSSAVGGWLYAVAARLPIWLEVPAAAVMVGTALTLRDAHRRAVTERCSHAARALGLLRLVLWHHRRLQAAMALSVVLGLSSFVLVWLIQPYAQARGVPVAWFGPLWAAAHLWLAGVSLASARVVAALGVTRTLLGCCLLVPLGYAGLATSPSAWGVAFYLCLMTVRGLQGPILSTVMQEDAPAEDRASVLSLAALLLRLAFVVVGPATGALVDREGMETALAVLAIVLGAASLAAVARFATVHRPPRERV
jgi:MFS family permease